MAFNPRFVNEAGNDLVQGKIHTIRKNYDYWKRFEGAEIALFTWQGKPYQKGSKQIVFCVKRVMSVQEIYLYKDGAESVYFTKHERLAENSTLFNSYLLSRNDGLDLFTFQAWFKRKEYMSGKMGIIHFTDFQYQ